MMGEHLVNDSPSVQGGDSNWEMMIDQIALIGEYTTPNGPAMDDHFLVLVDSSGRREELPVGTASLESVLKYLPERLNADLSTKLANQTNYASVILWPEELEGRGLFEFSPRAAKTLWGKLGRILGLHRVEITLSDTAREYLNSSAMQHLP
jgi:hypothetical protein